MNDITAVENPALGGEELEDDNWEAMEEEERLDQLMSSIGAQLFLEMVEALESARIEPVGHPDDMPWEYSTRKVYYPLLDVAQDTVRRLFDGPLAAYDPEVVEAVGLRALGYWREAAARAISESAFKPCGDAPGIDIGSVAIEWDDDRIKTLALFSRDMSARVVEPTGAPPPWDPGEVEAALGLLEAARKGGSITLPAEGTTEAWERGTWIGAFASFAYNMPGWLGSGPVRARFAPFLEAVRAAFPQGEWRDLTSWSFPCLSAVDYDNGDPCVPILDGPLEVLNRTPKAMMFAGAMFNSGDSALEYAARRIMESDSPLAGLGPGRNTATINEFVMVASELWDNGAATMIGDPTDTMALNTVLSLIKLSGPEPQMESIGDFLRLAGTREGKRILEASLAVIMAAGGQGPLGKYWSDPDPESFVSFITAAGVDRVLSDPALAAAALYVVREAFLCSSGTDMWGIEGLGRGRGCGRGLCPLAARIVRAASANTRRTTSEHLRSWANSTVYYMLTRELGELDVGGAPDVVLEAWAGELASSNTRPALIAVPTGRARATTGCRFWSTDGEWRLMSADATP